MARYTGAGPRRDKKLLEAEQRALGTNGKKKKKAKPKKRKMSIAEKVDRDFWS